MTVDRRIASGPPLGAAGVTPANGWEAEPSVQEARTDASSRGRSALVVGGCILVYLGLSFLSGASVWLHGPTTHLYEAGNGDASEGVWLLAQTPNAIVHGVNPFYTNWLHYPTGVNLVDNVGMQLLGLVTAPITLTAGPVLSWNVLMVLSFAGSATACFLVLRRWTAWWPAAFIGGLVYGFSPYMVAEGNSHLMNVVAPLPPLVLWTMDRILVRRSGSPWGSGLLLGLLLAAQLFISAELLSSTAVLLVVGAVVVLAAQALHRRSRPAMHAVSSRDGAIRLGMDLGYLWRAAAATVVVVVAAVAYPLWMAVAGPAHIVGPAQPVEVLKGLSTDVLTPIVPTINQRFTFGHAALGTRLVAEHGSGSLLLIDASENGGYLGIPLVVFLLAGVVALRRHRVVRFGAVMALAALVLSAGSELHVDGRFVGVPLPFTLLTHLKFFDSEVAGRYTVYVWLFVALLVALILDACHRAWTRRTGRAWWAAGAVVAAAALFPLVPSWPYPSGPIAIPAWFRSPFVARVPLGSTLLTFPFPSVASPQAMLWQADSGMRFRMPGGYVISPGPGGRATFYPPVTTASTALMSCASGAPAPPAVAGATTRAIGANLRHWHVETVVVPRNQQGWRCAAKVLSAVLGPPSSEAGSDVWHGPYRVSGQGS